MKRSVVAISLFVISIFGCKPAKPPLPSAPPPVAKEKSCECADGSACATDGSCPELVAASDTREIPEEATSEMPASCPVDASGRLSLENVHFEFNRANLTEQAQQSLRAFADCLVAQESIVVAIEGHCDERGTTEYNMALGQERAASVVRFLSHLGVAKSRLHALSMGENVPLCNLNNEACHAQNRRAELRANGTGLQARP